MQQWVEKNLVENLENKLHKIKITKREVRIGVKLIQFKYLSYK